MMFGRAKAIPAMSNLDARLRVMDAFPGYQQILSLASPPVETICTPDNAVEVARIGNDRLTGWCALHPDRFPGFVASLPLNNPDAAIAEATRVLKEPGAKGIQLFTSVNGQPLDKPAFLALIDLVARLGKAVWLHPIRPMTCADYPGEEASRFDLWWALGWPHESALAMGRLVFAGIFDKHPDLCVVTHHAGGTIPMLEGRLDAGLSLMGTRVPPGKEWAVETPIKEKPIAAFKRFHADTASFGSRLTIECGHAFFGTERMLFGTDMPFDPEHGPGFIRETLRILEELPWSEEQKEAVCSGNARRLFGLESLHA